VIKYLVFRKSEHHFYNFNFIIIINPNRKLQKKNSLRTPTKCYEILCVFTIASLNLLQT